MKNADVMYKIKDLYFRTSITEEERLMVQHESSILRRAFNVKDHEIEGPITDFERAVVLTNEEIERELQRKIEILLESKKIGLKQQVYSLERAILHFINGVRFFNATLANELDEIKEESGYKFPTLSL